MSEYKKVSEGFRFEHDKFYINEDANIIFKPVRVDDIIAGVTVYEYSGNILSPRLTLYRKFDGCINLFDFADDHFCGIEELNNMITYATQMADVIRYSVYETNGEEFWIDDDVKIYNIDADSFKEFDAPVDIIEEVD